MQDVQSWWRKGGSKSREEEEEGRRKRERREIEDNHLRGGCLSSHFSSCLIPSPLWDPARLPVMNFYENVVSFEQASGFIWVIFGRFLSLATKHRDINSQNMRLFAHSTASLFLLQSRGTCFSSQTRSLQTTVTVPMGFGVWDKSYNQYVQKSGRRLWKPCTADSWIHRGGN